MVGTHYNKMIEAIVNSTFKSHFIEDLRKLIIELFCSQNAGGIFILSQMKIGLHLPFKFFF